MSYWLYNKFERFLKSNNMISYTPVKQLTYNSIQRSPAFDCWTGTVGLE